MHSFPMNAYGLASEASNVRGGENPPFTRDDFWGPEGMFKQFANLVPEFILDQFIAMANSVVKESRWHEQWKFGMGLFIAHMLTLYLEAQAGANPTASQVVEAAKLKGLQTSASVGDVSVSYDFSSITEGIEGWVMYKSTQFGVQFIQFARLYAKAGMYVW